MSITTRTHRLPGNVYLTTIQNSPGSTGITAMTLRSMRAAHWYVLTGNTTSPDGRPTGWGAYVGTSAALNAHTVRAGVSLHHWANRLGRLTPAAVALIHADGQRPDAHVRHLLEAHIARRISAAGYTLLNTRTAAPTAYQATTRGRRLWCLEIGDCVADMLIDEIFRSHEPTRCGGNTREQLVRAILQQNPQRPLDVHQTLELAASRGITIRGRTPWQSARRDLAQRERAGRPRIYVTRVDGRDVFYSPAAFTASAARREYLRTLRPGLASRRRLGPR